MGRMTSALLLGSQSTSGVVDEGNDLSDRAEFRPAACAIALTIIASTAAATNRIGIRIMCVVMFVSTS